LRWPSSAPIRGLSSFVFLAWGEVYSLFSATSADAFGAKNIGSIYGTLYCAKGIAALLVPFANVIQEATGTWSTVLYIVASMDILAAISALVLLKPMLKRHHEHSAKLAAAKIDAGLLAAPLSTTGTGVAAATSASSLALLDANRALKAKLVDAIALNDRLRSATSTELEAEQAALKERIAYYAAENARLKG
jgi:hypothetical protein